MTGAQAGNSSRLARLHTRHQHTRSGLKAGWDTKCRSLGQQHEPGQGEIGKNTGRNHQGALGQGPVGEQIGIISINLIALLVVGEGDKASQRDRTQCELNPAPVALEQHRAEAD